MPEKITSKNLSYNTSLPPFLAALHAQAGNATGPDPLLARQRRAVKNRSASEEAEDAPLVVDERGNAVELEDEGAVKADEPNAAANGKQSESLEDEARKKDQEVKTSFGSRKRKVAKVVGDDATEEPSVTEKSREAAEDKQTDVKAQEPSEASTKKPKKKAKKVKLSFDDGD
jgi:hypothetical protein